jgi:3-dehydroquinate synthase
MPTITVPLPTTPYTIHLTELSRIGELVRPLIPGRRLVVVSNPVIFGHYGEPLVASLRAAGYTVTTCLIPPGERFKTLKTLQTIHDHCHQTRIDRQSGVIALGGGVVGDLTGFAAATWLRGVAVIQVPTSLLAMVDASIGGKTGVNTPQGKNLVGAFHQPRCVLIDPTVLATLPSREWRSGLAEVIKYGVIWDKDLFTLLEHVPHLARQPKVPPEILMELLTRSAQAKAEVVSKDEKESGLRALLNYGHTIGHAIETATHYRTYTHGEAVGLGMKAAGQLAARLGIWSDSDAARQAALIAAAGLPTQFPHLDPDVLMQLMQGDKKVQNDHVRFILPTTLGHATLHDRVNPDEVRAVLQELVSKGDQKS